MRSIPHLSILCTFTFSLSLDSMADSTNGAEAEVPVMKKVVFTTGKPQLYVEAPKANDAVSFFKAAFGAEEVNRTAHPKRKAEQEQPLLLSAELKIGGFSFLVSDFTDDAPPSEKTKASGSVICLETDDVEAAKAQAITAGAISEEGFVGEAEGGVGRLRDPFGNLWLISSAPKLATAEMTRRVCVV